MERADGEHGGGQVPGETHGDEHHVAVVVEVPLGAPRGVQHEADLQPRGSPDVSATPEKGKHAPPRAPTCPRAYLPEPAALQEGEGAAQQLQDHVAPVEDLQERHESLAEDGVEEELVHVHVQQAAAVQVVEENKSCRSEFIDAML